MTGSWVRDHKNRIYRWKCLCPGNWHRPLNVLQCQYCRASRPQPEGSEKPLDKAFKIIDEQLKKEKK